MLGGMSWESTAEYYRLANELVRDRLGGLHSARLRARTRSTSPRSRRCRSTGAGTRPATCSPRRRPRLRGRRRGAAAAVHQHHAQGRRPGAGGGRHPAAAPRRRHRRRGARAPGSTRVGLLATGVHHGAGLLPRPARRPRPATCSSPTPPTGPRCTGSSTTSCAAASSATSRAQAYRQVIDRLVAAGARGHHPRLHRDRAAHRRRPTARSRCSRPPGCTSRPPSPRPWPRRRSAGDDSGSGTAAPLPLPSPPVST